MSQLDASKLQQTTNHFNSNIVIKSENSKPTENNSNNLNNNNNTNISDDQSGGNRVTVSSDHQKLDDFEQLLDSANASSNIINKSLVCKKNNNDIMNNDSFHLKTVAPQSSSSLSEICNNKNSNLGVLNSFNAPDTNTTGIVGSTNSADSLVSSTLSQKLEFDFSPPTIASVAATSTCNQMMSSSNHLQNEEHDTYRDIIEEIRDNEWLHFQPLSPPLSPSAGLEFESDFFSDRKFAVELQMLDNNSFYADNETENNTTNCIDSTTYLTQPMTFNCRNNSLEIHAATSSTHENSSSSSSSCIALTSNEIGGGAALTSIKASSDGVTIKTEPIDEESKEDVQMTTNCIDSADAALASITSDEAINCREEFSTLLNNLDFTKSLFDSPQIGCSEFKLINEKALMQQHLDTVPMETESIQSATIKIENDEHSVNAITPSISIIKKAPIAELQTHNYVLQYGSPVSTPPTITQNDNVKYVTSNAGITNSTNLIQQQFVNTGNTIISSASPSQANKMQSIVYDNNTFVLTTTAPRKQMNGPADRGGNFGNLFKLLNIY